MKLEDLHVRDPFIYADPIRRKYYLYGTTCDMPCTFAVYVSDDLATFSEPVTIFKKNDSFWAERDFWASEMHCIDGRYYLFATFCSDSYLRRSAILSCDTPDGTFTPFVPSLTPQGWYSLDATYIEDKHGVKYAVFCHEWVQVGDGEMCAVRLNDRLEPVSEPKLLFRASDAAWALDMHKPPVPAGSAPGAVITDGPFIVLGESKYIMLWSSFSKFGYTVGQAVADEIEGPWEQLDKLVYTDDGGHCMIFNDLDGKMKLALHAPNGGREHVRIFDVLIENNTVRIL